MFKIVEKVLKVGDHEVKLEIGRIARQAGGAVFLTCGNTQIIVTACANKEAMPNQSFFPLSVDYIEKFYAAGRIPGGYFKREAKPTEREVLSSRLIDRSIRPLFPETYLVETQVIATLVSSDPGVPSPVLALLAASCALHISDIPFAGPVAGVRIGYKDDQFVINPSDIDVESSLLDLVVAGTKDGILMVEAGAKFVSEDIVLKALEIAHKEIKLMCAAQDAIRKKIGKEKRAYPEEIKHEKIQDAINSKYLPKIQEALSHTEKHVRKDAVAKVKEEAKAELVTAEDAESSKAFSYLFEMANYKTMRSSVLDAGRRLDGRKTTDIRNIDCQVGVLTNPHGSALFTRGETQSLGVVTLGTPDEAQRFETVMSPSGEKLFMLHYNMPGYSVGEVKRMMSLGRREVGHGNLAERALSAAIPPQIRFPYTIRVVSEITESNGSSSMASVCSGTLGLLDAGVPLVEPIAGIAMGLIMEGENAAVLSDILGDEDALGDMDFKVAGGRSGITALQMDIKIPSVSTKLLAKALEQARVGRLHILDKMVAVLGTANDVSERAPRIEQIKIKSDRIKDLIGPGGKNIKKIVAESGCKVNVDESGVVTLASTSSEAAAKAKRMIAEVTTDPEIGSVCMGVVKKIVDFGAFVEIKPGVEGLVHISQLDSGHVERVDQVVKEGEEIMVKIMEVDKRGKIKLSRKDALTV